METEDLKPFPLFNHLIMRQVLKHLDFRDWKVCRNVCKEWNSFALEMGFCSEALITLDRMKLLQFTDLLRIGDFFQHSPFENYNLQLDDEGSDSDAIFQVFQTFWECVQECIKSLRLELKTRFAKSLMRYILDNGRLERVKFIVKEGPGHFLEDFGRGKLPVSCKLETNYNLKTFSYIFVENFQSFGGVEHADEVFSGSSFPLSREEFLTKFPNLQDISLVGLSYMELTELLMTWKEIKGTRKVLNHLTKLEILDQDDYPIVPNDRQVELLTDLELSLTNLHLEISPLLRTDLFNEFISSISPTLRTLRLRRVPQTYRFREIDLQLSCLINLTFLEISDGMIHSLEFLPFLPNLKVLQVLLRYYSSLPDCDILQNTPITSYPHPVLEKLYIEPPLAGGDECVYKIQTLFPNLQRLKLRVNNDMLQTLFAHHGEGFSSSLLELHLISHGGLNDKGFTGVDASAYPFLKTDTLLDYPCVGNLQNLQRLVVEMWSDYSNHFTDASIYYGISCLKSLKSLDLVRAEEISSTAIAFLERGGISVNIFN